MNRFSRWVYGWLLVYRMTKYSNEAIDDESVRRTINTELEKQGLGQLPQPPSYGCQYHYFFSKQDFCGRHQLGGSKYCLWHHRSTEKYDTSIVSLYFGEPITFWAAIEREAISGKTLAGAYLEEAQLGGDEFRRGVDLHGADLRGANLRSAKLSYARLRDANLAFTNLEFAYLSDADIRGAFLGGANLFNAKFRNNDFVGVKGLTKECFRNPIPGIVPRHRILETYPDQAEPMYRALISYFVTLGALDDASWAAYRCRVMHHEILRTNLSLTRCIMDTIMREKIYPTGDIDARHAFETGIAAWMASIFKFPFSWVNRWITGYGEKPFRVAMFSGAVVAAYAAIYAWSHALTEGGFLAAIYFSIVTFTTLGYGDILPKLPFRLLAASESVAGLLLVGLFLFTLARRSVGRA